MSTPQYYQTNYNFSGNTTTTAPSTTDIGTSLVPVGTLLLYGGTTLPANYLWCNGASLSTTTYSILFNVLGYTYGGADSSFNLPDMSGNVPIGASTTSTMKIIYQGSQSTSGGNKNMTSNQLASHTHNPLTGTGFWTKGDQQFISVSNTNIKANFDNTTGDVSGGTGQDFLPPFIVVNYIIKYR